jgi:hypothetical protein
MITDASAARTCCDESVDNSLTQGRMYCEATCGLTMLQNLVTLPAAAIRTSASLSRSSRPYAGTSSVLFPVDTRMSVHLVYITRQAHIHIAWLSVLAVEIKPL